MARYDESNMDEPVEEYGNYPYIDPDAEKSWPDRHNGLMLLIYGLILLLMMFAFGGGTDSGWMAY